VSEVRDALRVGEGAGATNFRQLCLSVGNQSDRDMCASRLTPVRILVADNHRVIRAGIRVLLAEKGPGRPFEVEEAATTEEAIDKVFSSKFDIVLIEYGLPGRGGPKATEIILKRRPDIRILGWSYTDERVPVEQMLNAGAKGYLLKNIELETLLSAIWTVLGGKRFFSNEIALQLMAHAPVSPPDRLDLLTDREKLVFRLILEGLPDREVAVRLSISKRTVDKHRQRLMAKLGVRNAVGLVQAGVKMGLVV